MEIFTSSYEGGRHCCVKRDCGVAYLSSADYNGLSFRPPLAFRDTLAVTARDVGSPEGVYGNVYASRAWKGNTRRSFLRPFVSFPVRDESNN